MSRFNESMGGSSVIGCAGRERCCGTRVRARAFDRASFDARAGPVRCRRAVPRSSDGSTVAAHEESECCWEEAVCVERTELVQLQRPPNVCMLVHARAQTKTRGNPDQGMRVLFSSWGRVAARNRAATY